MLRSLRALSRSASAASRLSWLSLMVLRVRKPSKSDTVDPIVNDVLDVLLFSYVFCAVSPRPNEKFWAAEPLRSGRRLFLSVFSCRACNSRVFCICFTLMLWAMA